MVVNGKPEPDLFLHAAGTMGVHPGECIVVEDSVNGVLAGKAAGMRVIGFTVAIIVPELMAMLCCDMARMPSSTHTRTWRSLSPVSRIRSVDAASRICPPPGPGLS